jgi:predicted metal-dependent phosphoesterase TrpH
MEEYLPFLDAIETGNARNSFRKNWLAERFAAEHGLYCTAGSDAHDVSELGAMGLVLPNFNNSEELRLAIKTARVYGKESPAWVHLYSRIAVIRKAFMKN